MRIRSNATPRQAQAKDHDAKSAAITDQLQDFYRLRDRWRRGITISHRLSAADKLVALVLLEHASREHWRSCRRLECWPSQNRIAALIHRASRNILGTLRRLVGHGMIVVVRRGNPISHESARYRFDADWLLSTEAEAVEAVEKWPDRRLNRSGDENITRSHAESIMSPRDETGTKLVMETSPNHTDESFDSPPDNPTRAAARDGGKIIRERVDGRTNGCSTNRPRGRAAQALLETVAELEASGA